MSKENEQQPPEHVGQSEDGLQTQGDEKKPFVEPTLSAPVNVFDATTFFLQGTTGEGEL